jgi:Helicase associated domain
MLRLQPRPSHPRLLQSRGIVDQSARRNRDIIRLSYFNRDITQAPLRLRPGSTARTIGPVPIPSGFPFLFQPVFIFRTPSRFSSGGATPSLEKRKEDHVIKSDSVNDKTNVREGNKGDFPDSPFEGGSLHRQAEIDIWDQRWEERYGQLKKIVDDRGVDPDSHNPILDLANDEEHQIHRWVGMQRYLYRLYLQEKEGTTMTEDRIRRIQALGISLSPVDTKWDAKFRQLQDFLKRNEGRFPNECDSSTLTREDKLLHRWCQRQRFEYKQYKDRIKESDEEPPSNDFITNNDDHFNASGSSDDFSYDSDDDESALAPAGPRLPMTADRIERLKAIGFSFEVYADQWRERYNQLKRYVDHHGHAMVPYKYEANPQLGIWVSEQR